MIRSLFTPVKECKNYIIFVSVVFIISIVVGLFIVDPNNNIMKGTFEKIQNIAEAINDKNSIIYTISTIFINNFFIALLMIVFGIFFGVYPTIIIIINGIFIGTYIRLIYEELHSISFLLVGLLPHGIFELSAIIISAAFGIRIGHNLIKLLIKLVVNKEVEKYKSKFKYNLKQIPVLLLGVLLILLVAAIIESTLSVYLINVFYN